MKNSKKYLALFLTAAMTLSMAACGNDGKGNNESSSGSNSGSGNSNVDMEKIFGVGDGHIEIGSHWVQHYDSKEVAAGDMNVSTDWVNAQPADTDDPNTAEQKAFNRTVAQMRWDNVGLIEKNYGVTFSWENLTWEGVRDSVNTSIIAGSPDCEIYLLDAQAAIAAQMNGLAVDLKTILPEDDDLFTTQTSVGYLDMGDGKVCILYEKTASGNIEGSYPLGFNMQMLEENNLEDPRDLWERGEWTWDKFIEYCQILTQDTDGDGQPDQYGYCGYQQETFEQLLMSNGASIASGTQETLSSAATGEVLQMMYDMYNTYKSADGYSICYPYDYDYNTNSDTMRIQYCQGNVAFFPIALWIAAGQNNYSPNSAENDYSDKHLTFDTAYVRWPVGYSGNKDTNPGKNSLSGNYYIIAAGSQNPGTAYKVLSDFFNWYHSDTSLRDNRAVLHWWYDENAFDPELQEQNVAVLSDCGAHTAVDFWNNLGSNIYSTDAGSGITALMKGEMTPAQFQESFKQRVQDGLDAIYGK